MPHNKFAFTIEKDGTNLVRRPCDTVCFTKNSFYEALCHITEQIKELGKEKIEKILENTVAVPEAEYKREEYEDIAVFETFNIDWSNPTH